MRFPSSWRDFRIPDKEPNCGNLTCDFAEVVQQVFGADERGFGGGVEPAEIADFLHTRGLE